MILAAATDKDTGFVLTLHQGFANVLVIYSVILALWGFVLFIRGANPSGGYLGALVILEGVALLQGLIGITLLGQGHRPEDSLHFLYGIVAVATLPVAYTLSDRGKTRRDSIVFALATIFMVGIAIRGITTGGG